MLLGKASGGLVFFQSQGSRQFAAFGELVCREAKAAAAGNDVPTAGFLQDKSKLVGACRSPL
jgi:hypothetical protein